MALVAALTLAAGAGNSQILDVRQATNLSLALDPGGDYLVLDLLGGLWRLPVTGGGATALIPTGSGIAQPRFDPAGERIVFQRWLDGQWDLWQLTLADGSWTALTETEFNEREPEFSADGRSVVFAGDRNGRYSLWSLSLATGDVTELTQELGNARYPTRGPDGTITYINQNETGSSLNLHRSGPVGQTVLTSEGTLGAPSWRPGGGVVLFNERSGGYSDLTLYIEADEPIRRQMTAGEDVFVSRPAWLSPAEYVYTADGQIWRRTIASVERTPIHLFANMSVEPATLPIVSRALDAPGPHPVIGINSLVQDPASERRAFSALGDLWLLERDRLSRLTDDEFTDAWPQFVADKNWLLFLSDRAGDMDIWQLDLDSDLALRLSDEPGRVVAPRVSPDGRYVAFLTVDGDRMSDAAALKLIEIARPYQSQTLAAGLLDASGLAWDGGRVLLVAREAGQRKAAARVFDTPVGFLPVEPEARSRETVTRPETELTWSPETTAAPFVIRAERLFDGVGNNYRHDVDIHIEGQRITNVVRRGTLPLPERVIDLSDRTIVPGLIDVHVHHDPVIASDVGRAWLRNGVTTVREVMSSDLSAAIERAETWASGRQPGPRLVISPLSPATITIPEPVPIVVGTGTGWSIAHSAAAQQARYDYPAGTLPSIVPPDTASGIPRLALSPLGRSYQDVIGPLAASGAYVTTGLAAINLDSASESVEGLSTTIAQVMRSSGRVAVGSDAPAVPYGSGYHDELELLAAQGIPASQILRWATAGGAIALGLSQQLGTVEPGRLADLLVIDGDPLARIEDLRAIETVIKGGIRFESGALTSRR